MEKHGLGVQNEDQRQGVLQRQQHRPASTDLAGVTTDNVQNGTQTELKRFYIGVDHKFNDIFSANLTTDFRYNTNGTSKDVLVYVKKAYRAGEARPRTVPSASARPTCHGFRSSKASTATASSRTR